jgi:protein-tyrosine phosphatase
VIGDEAGDEATGAVPVRVLVLCTGNVCRSPMAEVMLRARLDQRGVPAVVTSAGSVTEDRPPTDEVLELLEARGLDGSHHRSRLLDTDLLADADLVLAMARLHVRDASLHDPGAFARTFTLKELVRRGSAVGPRLTGESIDDWLARAGEGRRPTDLLGDSEADDVADPMGRRFGVFKKTATELDGLLDQLVDLAWPAPP